MKVMTPEHLAKLAAGRERARQEGASTVKSEGEIPLDLNERQKEQVKLVRRVAPKALGVLLKAFSGSRPAMIKSKCQECVNYEEMTSRIRNCETSGCGLWAGRPYQNDNDQDDGEQIKEE